ncbi:Protein ELC-like, partial [Linum perenne]
NQRPQPPIRKSKNVDVAGDSTIPLLRTLATAYPSLEPKTSMFTHNDGRSVNLLQAEGTIPMVFTGVTYNIPIIIWLMDSYPRYPSGHSPSFSSNPSNSSSFGSISGPYQRPMVRPYPPSPYGSAIPARPQQTDDAAEVFRRNAINKIVEMSRF